MHMVPDYDTLECRFKFGLPPSAADEEEARAVACFAACPAKGALRGSPSRCAMVGGSSELSANTPPVPCSAGPSVTLTRMLGQSDSPETDS